MRFCTPTVSKPSSRVLGRVHARQLLLYRLLVDNVKLFTEDPFYAHPFWNKFGPLCNRTNSTSSVFA